MSGMSKIQSCGGKLLQSRKIPAMYAKLEAVYLDKEQDIKLAKIKHVGGEEVENWLPLHTLLAKYKFVEVTHTCDDCKIKCMEVNNFEE